MYHNTHKSTVFNTSYIDHELIFTELIKVDTDIICVWVFVFFVNCSNHCSCCSLDGTGVNEVMDGSTLVLLTTLQVSAGTLATNMGFYKQKNMHPNDQLRAS